MSRKSRFRRGQILQDHNQCLYIYVKSNGSYSHVVLLDDKGVPEKKTMVKTNTLKTPFNLPKNFKIIEL
jgi:hypothetical protein